MSADTPAAQGDGLVRIERTKFRCPHCGSEEVSIYFERHRMVRGVADADIPVVVHFSAHRIHCRDCGEFGARILLEDWCATARATEVPEPVSHGRDHREAP